MDFETYGFDLLKFVEVCKDKGNHDLAKLIETQIKNLQTCYNVIAERHSSCPDEDITNIDPKYLESKLIK